MKYTYKLRNLDCANCAAKMERAIEKLEGVNAVSVNFIMQKMILDIENEKITIEDIKKVINKIEPDCVVL